MSSYPPNPRSGVPTTIAVSPQNATILRGNTLQLNPTLTDAYGNTVTPSQSFTYSSSNPALVSVNQSGLCTAAPLDPTVLQTGGSAQVEISYPWANDVSGAKIYASAAITVTVPAARTVWLGNVSKNYPASD